MPIPMSGTPSNGGGSVRRRAPLPQPAREFCRRRCGREGTPNLDRMEIWSVPLLCPGIGTVQVRGRDWHMTDEGHLTVRDCSVLVSDGNTDPGTGHKSTHLHSRTREQETSERFRLVRVWRCMGMQSAENTQGLIQKPPFAFRACLLYDYWWL